MSINVSTQIFAYVLEISKCGSISRAAQNLFVSQPNLSTSLKALEEALGFNIFLRSPKGIVTTPEGTLFLQSAEIIVSELEHITKIPQICEQAQEEGLSIVCVYSSYILHLMIQFIQDNHIKYSKNTFKETGLNHAMDDIVAKTYRLGFFYDFECNHYKREKLAEKYFLDIHLLRRDIPVMAIVKKEHPLAESRSVSIAQLAQYPLVTYEDFEYDDWLGCMGVDRYASALYIFDRGGMLEAVRGSGCVGISAASHSELNGVVQLPITGIENRLNQYWVKSSSCLLSSHELEFIRFVKSSFSQKFGA